MTPLVSICCLTFNHSQLINDALQGFLIQQTNFEFEILIYDDASTDGTAEILKTYEERYPELFKIYYQSDNQYLRGNRKLNSTYNFSRAKGKYIALCEGDDYWIDPHKLQKQVDFLEKHSEYTASVHSVIIDWLIPQEKYSLNYDVCRDFDLSMNGILKRAGSVYPTCSLLARTDLFCKMEFGRFPIAEDFVIISHLKLYGKIRFFAEKMGCYRIHGGGVHQSQARKKSYILKNRLGIIRFYYQLLKVLPIKYVPVLTFRCVVAFAQYVFLRVKFL